MGLPQQEHGGGLSELNQLNAKKTCNKRLG